MQNLIKSSVILWLLFAILILLTMLLPNARAYGQSDSLTYTPLKEKKVIDTEFIAVSSYLVLMTVFDVETTFAAIRNSGGREANPIMRPFVKNGRAATYAVQLAVDALFIYIAYEMKGSKHKEFRKMWWISPSIVGTAHGIAGGLNLRYIW